MIRQIAQGAWIHASDFLQSNAVIVEGDTGLLLVDPGITSSEMEVLANDIKSLGKPVVAAFSTHPHWDHLLWHPHLGDAPRYGTARNYSEIRDFMVQPDWKERAAAMLPQDLADKIPIDETFACIAALPEGTERLEWLGPATRIIEHRGHAIGSAALFFEDMGILVAGDMLSDILTPFLELDSAHPIEDYLAALQVFESMAGQVKIFIPGHGSIGDADELLSRIEQDRAYVEAVRTGGGLQDYRLTNGPRKDLLASVHEWQVSLLAKK